MGNSKCLEIDVSIRRDSLADPEPCSSDSGKRKADCASACLSRLGNPWRWCPFSSWGGEWSSLRTGETGSLALTLSCISSWSTADGDLQLRITHWQLQPQTFSPRCWEIAEKATQRLPAAQTLPQEHAATTLLRAENPEQDVNFPPKQTQGRSLLKSVGNLFLTHGSQNSLL